VDPHILSGLRAIVDPQRLRIFARLASRPAAADVLASELRLPLPAVRRNLEVLAGAGLVEVRDGAFAARVDRLGELARALAELDRAGSGETADAGPGGAWPHDGASLADTLARMQATPEETRVLRSFLVDGRLVTIPVLGRKRLVVLRFLLERVFTEAREYPEKEVNQRLALFNPDVAALRRYLVDEGFVDRAAGLYRRRDTRPEG
jgi:DNA-binding transcriptional ArsR family regulator